MAGLGFDRGRQMIDRHLYKGYLLSCAPMQLDDGRFQARVGIASMDAQKTRAQRFLDLGYFDTEAEAAAHAREAGMKWVDTVGDITDSGTSGFSWRTRPSAPRGSRLS
jgi:hypothetical protein